MRFALSLALLGVVLLAACTPAPVAPAESATSRQVVPDTKDWQAYTLPNTSVTFKHPPNLMFRNEEGLWIGLEYHFLYPREERVPREEWVNFLVSVFENKDELLQYHSRNGVTVNTGRSIRLGAIDWQEVSFSVPDQKPRYALVGQMGGYAVLFSAPDAPEQREVIRGMASSLSYPQGVDLGPLFARLNFG